MYKGKYFVISSGGLGTETMVIFPSNVDVETVKTALDCQVHNDRVVSSGTILFRSNPYNPGMMVVCESDSEYDDREAIDQRVAEKTFQP